MSEYKYRHYNPQVVLHYKGMMELNEIEINSFFEPLVVVHSDESNQHKQIKIEPFKTAHADKFNLTFAEKLQYFKQQVRQCLAEGPAVIFSEIEEDDTVLKAKVDIFDHYDGMDGLSSELDDFNNGFTNKPITGYGSNVQLFFDTFFADFSAQNLADWTTAINA